MSYTRVIPRDLFNEAKLLKCMGRLALHIHDGALPGCTLEFTGDADEGFRIDQDVSGDLFVENLAFRIHDRLTLLASNYNAKSAYPLFVLGNADVDVFDDVGNLTPAFLELARTDPDHAARSH